MAAENWECREDVTYYPQCPEDTHGIYCCNGYRGCVTWLRKHLKRRRLNHTKSRKIDRKQWVFETELGWEQTKVLTKEFVDECIAFDRKRKRERAEESEARKQARHELEAAAYCYLAQQKVKAAEAAEDPKADEAAEDPKAAEAAEDPKSVKAPKADKAVQVRVKADKADKAVQVGVPSDAAPAPVNGVSPQPSDGQKVVSGLAESVAKMRLIITALSTNNVGVTPQITSAAAGGLNRQLDAMDLVVLALRSHVQ